MSERVLGWMSRQLARLGGGGRGTVLSWAVVLAAVGGAVALAARFSRTVTPDPGGAPSPAPGRPRSPQDWRAEAVAHEQAGRWRLGLRCRYRALLGELAARELVEEVPGRTAGEYRSEVARNLPAASSDFAGATELFERAWYGNVDSGAEEAERFARLAERVLSGSRG